VNQRRRFEKKRIERSNEVQQIICSINLCIISFFSFNDIIFDIDEER
jgi:uncharacterized membrane protein YuzA (DUF378 family)